MVKQLHMIVQTKEEGSIHVLGGWRVVAQEGEGGKGLVDPLGDPVVGKDHALCHCFMHLQALFWDQVFDLWLSLLSRGRELHSHLHTLQLHSTWGGGGGGGRRGGGEGGEPPIPITMEGRGGGGGGEVKKEGGGRRESSIPPSALLSLKTLAISTRLLTAPLSSSTFDLNSAGVEDASSGISDVTCSAVAPS